MKQKGINYIFHNFFEFFFVRIKKSSNFANAIHEGV